MKGRLPPVSGKELIKLLSKLGIHPIRQSGSHVQLRGTYKGEARYTTVPLHGKEIPKGLVLQILKDCGLTREELLPLLKKEF